MSLDTGVLHTSVTCKIRMLQSDIYGVLGPGSPWARRSSRAAQVSWVKHFLVQKVSCQGKDEGQEEMMAFSSEGWLGLTEQEYCG